MTFRFGLLISQFLTILDFPILLFFAHSTLHSSPATKTDFNYALESLSNVFSALPGSSGSLCSPAGDACCYYPAPLLACASWFKGKRYAVLCYLVTQMNHFTDKRSTQNRCPEQEPEAPPVPAGSICIEPWIFQNSVFINLLDF